MSILSDNKEILEGQKDCKAKILIYDDEKERIDYSIYKCLSESLKHAK